MMKRMFCSSFSPLPPPFRSWYILTEQPSCPVSATRAKKFGLSFVPASVQHDIYKKISPYKNLLHLPGCRQKQLEEFIGIHREDHFNGGELIELYHSYARQPTKELLDILLLHNREDLEGMTTLYRVMAIPLFFEEQGFSPVTLSLEHTEDAFGKSRTNAVFTCRQISLFRFLCPCMAPALF